jgi:hypothetical protein
VPNHYMVDVTYPISRIRQGSGQRREVFRLERSGPEPSLDRHRLNKTIRYWSAHAQPVICHPELPFFKDIVTMPLSVTGLPALLKLSVVGVTRYA